MDGAWNWIELSENMYKMSNREELLPCGNGKMMDTITLLGEKRVSCEDLGSFTGL